MSTDVPTFVLEGELTIAQAAQTRERLIAALEQGVRCLDLGQVTEFDSAGVQLLLSACKTAQNAEGTLSVAPVSETVREVLARYGLLRLLGAAA